jgi:hypothetical protein
MAIASPIEGEEYYQIAIGQGMYTSELPSNIPDGFSAICYNLVATGDSLENRIGIRKTSIDWKVYQEYPTSVGRTVDIDTMGYFCQIDPWGGDSSQPAFMWGSRGNAVTGGALNTPLIHFMRAEGTHDAGTGYFTSTSAGLVTGICQYGGVIYYSSTGTPYGVYKVTALNWTTPAYTPVQIASTASFDFQGLFTFKDRIWGWRGYQLWFTDLPTVGGQPETWAGAANQIKFIGPNGAGQIKSIVPLGNRLAVFTTNGLFTLLVEGAPASWILRVLNSKSISTSSQCAFETNGIIYFVNTTGVWATNTLSVSKLSAVIDDQWFLAKGKRVHTINQYEDGLIVSIGKQGAAGYFDKDNCKVFYSKLDPIGWTEWNINSYEASATRPERLVMVWSVTDKIPTYLNPDPTVYTNLFISDSTLAASQKAVFQFLIFDGGQDQYSDRTGTTRTAPVGIYLKSKHFDGGNQYSIKNAKKGMLEIFTNTGLSLVEHKFTTSWDTDVTVDPSTEVREVALQDSVVGVGSNMVLLRAQFRYRRASFNLRTELQDDVSQIKIKDIALAQDTGRGTFEQIS